jgi:hypothetical protein
MGMCALYFIFISVRFVWYGSTGTNMVNSDSYLAKSRSKHGLFLSKSDYFEGVSLNSLSKELPFQLYTANIDSKPLKKWTYNAENSLRLKKLS